LKKLVQRLNFINLSTMFLALIVTLQSTSASLGYAGHPYRWGGYYGHPYRWGGYYRRAEVNEVSEEELEIPTSRRRWYYSEGTKKPEKKPKGEVADGYYRRVEEPADGYYSEKKKEKPAKGEEPADGYGWGGYYRRADEEPADGYYSEKKKPEKKGEGEEPADRYWWRRAEVDEVSEEIEIQERRRGRRWGGYYTPVAKGRRRTEEGEIPENEIEVAPERLPIEVSLATPIQRHPEDCTVYFIYNIPYQCPEGMAFDMKDLVCVEEDAADCPKPTPCDLKSSRLLKAAEDEL